MYSNNYLSESKFVNVILYFDIKNHNAHTTDFEALATDLNALTTDLKIVR